MDWQSGNGRIRGMRRERGLFATGEEVRGLSCVLIEGRMYERRYKMDSR